MNKETIVCLTKDCGQTCEVLISTGYNKPENKGRKYINCIKCNKFNWVEGMATPDQIEETIAGYDKEARGKTKCAVICAVIQHGGLEALKGQDTKIENLVDFIMNSTSQKEES